MGLIANTSKLLSNVLSSFYLEGWLLTETVAFKYFNTFHKSQRAWMDEA